MVNNERSGDCLVNRDAFPYCGHFSMTFLSESHRLFGLDAFDWLILLTGSALSGAMVLLI